MGIRFKLDENIPRDAQVLLREAGHDIQTVIEERLAGRPDTEVLVACLREKRILVTLDLDFTDIRFRPPANHSGIWALRPPMQSIASILDLLREVERAFAEAMNSRQDIRLFIKLPSWFQVETPVGTYNPDWAIVKEDDAKIYLVRETKGTKDQFKLRGSEWAKIQCGKAHFGSLDVDFAHVTSPGEV